MNLQQAIKTLVTAKAYVGMSNWFFDKGNQAKAEFCELKACELFLSVPDKIGTKARKVLGE